MSRARDLADGTFSTDLSVISGASTYALIDSDGLKFNGDTAAANALDDFETGSFEPTLLGSSSNPTVTYHSDTGGYYLKIGKLLYVTGAIRWSTAFSGGSGTAMIGNLPFTLAARTNGDNSDSLGVARLPAWNGSGTVSPNAVKGNQSSTTLSMQCIEIGSPTTTIQISHLGSNCMISFTAMVHTS